MENEFNDYALMSPEDVKLANEEFKSNYKNLVMDNKINKIISEICYAFNLLNKHAIKHKNNKQYTNFLSLYNKIISLNLEENINIKINTPKKIYGVLCFAINKICLLVNYLLDNNMYNDVKIWIDILKDSCQFLN